MAQLSGTQIKQLQEAILEAFAPDEFEQFLKTHLERELAEFSLAGNFRQVVFDVVRAAERAGWTADLLTQLKAARPDRADLHPLWDDLLAHITGSQLTSARFTIPGPVADFTGRAAELDGLVAHLSADGASAHIAGVRGMGGVGKTQLAYAVAERLRDRYPDAALLVEMQPGDTPIAPEAALKRVLLALFPTATLPDALGELQALYRNELGGRRGLRAVNEWLNE